MTVAISCIIAKAESIALISVRCCCCG